MAEIAQAKKDKGPKFKVGDYISSPGRVWLKVVSVIDDGVMPIYGLVNPKVHDRHIQWQTQFQTDEDKLVAGKPDFESMAKVQSGDILLAGAVDDEDYVRVLARVGDAVLLSRAPQKKQHRQITKLSDQIKDLTDGEMDMMSMIDDDAKDMLRKMASTTYNAKMADEWATVEYLALMNWKLISEEN